ncbi:LacI family DNA-binding transcriptional regulator [Devosia sp. ZB163]|uniref:LacI family DNA-binding transcriptional regulator n=1 Tax=Devosia sp. ZB163 TaxID=3025938 RepID=UPI002360CE84|nr:LacI family DNA-binding transcriptional regulator [Devosia sp. ZB163]MDC9825958.1 LacI family DNA-binding transcriptional regulator [Devosia sp. ZB163]
MAASTKSGTGRVTIKTVAADAGVSVAAVSKVLRDAYGVSDALRAKVQASMEKLNYRPHAAARAMRGRTYALGVLLPDLRNPFFADILAGINEALERTQYQPLMGVGQSAHMIEISLIESMIDRQMDGLIMIGPRMPPDAVDEVTRRIPTALVGYYSPLAQQFDTVNDDDIYGAELVVRHLVESGYRRITMVSLTQPLHESVIVHRREIGYRKAMMAAGLSQYIDTVSCPMSPREVLTTIRHLLERRDRPEALFCWTDSVALQAISAARDLGLSIPNDLGVVGYDNTTYCDMAQNSLTSVDQSGQVLGLQAARLLVERIDGRTQGEHFVVTPRLVARGSSRPRRS